MTELVDHLAPTDHGRALQYARRWLEVDPVSEQAHRSLMELYAAAGDRGAAMKQYADCDRALREAFGMQPDAATRALRDAIRDEDRVSFARGAAPAVGAGPAAAGTAAAGQAARSRGNLPRRRDPYIGREPVITQTRERLQSALVVTLVGAAGIGKTRLAVQTDLSMAEQLAHGAWLIDLAPITDEAMIDVAAARTLAIPEGPRRSAIALTAVELRRGTSRRTPVTYVADS